MAVEIVFWVETCSDLDLDTVSLMLRLKGAASDF